MLLDCRHGLVLLSDWTRRQFVVWDPVTGDQHRVTVPAGFDPKRTEISGAVLRAAGDVQHFQVVCVATRCDDIQHGEAAVACVYLSETGEWGNLVSTPVPSGSSIELYRMLSFRTISREPAVLTQSLAVTRVPHVPIDHFKVIRADSGGLCFLYMSESDFTVQLWKPETNCNILGSSRLGRTIELGKLLPVEQGKDNIFIVGFAEENNMVFLRTLKGLYAVHLQ
nr:uncharacterized protein LOC109736934 [Aegilops tauschii subsp. strangulata]